MPKAHGGRRVGSGRKATLNKTEKFSTRISEEDRKALDLRAKLEGRSVSETAAILLRQGLNKKRNDRRSDETVALCRLISELVDIVAPGTMKTDSFDFNWRTDPFLFEALRLGISNTLDALRPPGEPLPPSERAPQLKGAKFLGPLEDPAARAEYATTILLHNLEAAKQNPEDMLAGAPNEIDWRTKDTPNDLYQIRYMLNKGLKK